MLVDFPDQQSGIAAVAIVNRHRKRVRNGDIAFWAREAVLRFDQFQQRTPALSLPRFRISQSFCRRFIRQHRIA
jgi:hypothetical protein